MPHNFKKDDSKELTYQFEEDALVVHFYEKKIKKIPYHSIIGVEALRERLKGIKGVHAVGKHYWLTYGEIVGQSNQFPSLMVYSTSITKGILLQRKFEKILLSPEKEEEFLKELEKRVEVLKTAEV